MDGICLKAAVGIVEKGAFSSPISLTGSTEGRKYSPAQLRALGCSTTSASSSNGGISVETSTPKTRFPLISILPGRRRKPNEKITLDDGDPTVFLQTQQQHNEEEDEKDRETRSEDKRGSWILNILRIKSLFWKQNEVIENKQTSTQCSCYCSSEDEQSHSEDQQEEKMEVDRECFSNLLTRVPLTQAKLYAQMCYLGNLAYSIPKIKPENLLKFQSLRYVTSSVEKKAQSMKAKEVQISTGVQEMEEKSGEAEEGVEHSRKNNGYGISASTAYRIAASAASYVQSRTRSILPFNSSKNEMGENCIGTCINAEITSSDMASFVATTNSLTAVVAAKEETKQAVAKDLSSVHSSPCEWFVCDDDHSRTRIFAIQGSETLASWKANLLFEPIQFEGLDVLVHRGIYEAAKGIYEQILPEVRSHMKSHGDSAAFRFTGHSLGGSLSLLINLLLIVRGEVPISTLLPVITFGSPTIMCGGDQLLRRLGLPRNHVQSVTIHRDIVPRAFSCNYPDHVIDILRTVNGNFRSHPCLKNEKLLFAPTGEILILQPDEKVSPNHHLLPTGTGLYILSFRASEASTSEKQLAAAQSAFLNSPHPLEILSGKSSYGSGGAIYRDHDMKAYLRAMYGVIREEVKHSRKRKRGNRRGVWWPLVIGHGGISLGGQLALSKTNDKQSELSGMFGKRGESLKRFGRLVASQHMHLLMLLFFPMRWVIIGVHAVFSFN